MMDNQETPMFSGEITQEEFDSYPEHYQQFARDCRDAGFPLVHYNGRWGWQGPAAKADDVHDVIRCTEVPVQNDTLGLRYIVYPRG